VTTHALALLSALRIAVRYDTRVRVYGVRESRCTCSPALRAWHNSSPDEPTWEYYLRYPEDAFYTV